MFSVGARKLSMTGSIRNFENKNFTPKLRIFVSLKVKPPDMTDWHTIASLSGTFVYKLFRSKRTMLSSEFNLNFYIRFHIPGCFSVCLNICTIDFIKKFCLCFIQFLIRSTGEREDKSWWCILSIYLSQPIKLCRLTTNSPQPRIIAICDLIPFIHGQ